MEIPTRYVCPRCDYDLVPVHAVDGEKRRVIALTCPEPYCDHMQMVSKREAKRIERGRRQAGGGFLRRAAN